VRREHPVRTVETWGADRVVADLSELVDPEFERVDHDPRP